MARRRVGGTGWLLFMVTAKAVASYETRYFEQSLTHDETQNLTFRQRYLYDASHWGHGGAPLGSAACPGPVLFYTGNEGPIDAFWAANGFVRRVLAPRWGALVIFAEERYYGESLPFGTANESLTAAHAAYLRTDLILQDYVALIRFLNPGNVCPVVAVGGSYGGTLTTFLRVAHPEVVVGGLAASAPVGYYDAVRWAEFHVTAETWAAIVAAVYAAADPACPAAIARSMAAIRAADLDDLLRLFGTCDLAALRGSSAGDNTALFAYALEALPQGDYPPTWPVASWCAALQRGPPLEAAAALTRETLFQRPPTVQRDDDAMGCIPALAQGPGGVPGDGPGDRSAWGLQSCTETLHLFESRSSVIRNYTLDRDALVATCRRLFGVVPDTTALTRAYGGYDIPNEATNLIFSNGFMPNGAHHCDLRAPTADDPEDVVACRALEERTMRGWIVDFFHRADNERTNDAQLIISR